MSSSRADLLVFGKSGQLASALGERSGAVCLGRGDVDVCSFASVAAAIAQFSPRAVINAAAYTAVDRAEREQEAAMSLNAVAPAVIALATVDAGVPLVHVSTDYVFDGAGGAPYVEDAPVNPLNVYGKTKAKGEEKVLSVAGQAAVLRTSWVFSERPGNFVTTMLRLARDRDEIEVVFDVAGRPTSSHSLATACADLAEAMTRDQGVEGIFHFADEGEASWFVLAEDVMREAEARGWKSASIRPIASADYPATAQRPRDTRLATNRLARLLGWSAPHWRRSLHDTLDRLAKA